MTGNTDGSKGETIRLGKVPAWIVISPLLVTIISLLALNSAGLIPYPFGLLYVLSLFLGLVLLAMVLRLVAKALKLRILR